MFHRRFMLQTTCFIDFVPQTKLTALVVLLHLSRTNRLRSNCITSIININLHLMILASNTDDVCCLIFQRFQHSSPFINQLFDVNYIINSLEPFDSVTEVQRINNVPKVIWLINDFILNKCLFPHPEVLQLSQPMHNKI